MVKQWSVQPIVQINKAVGAIPTAFYLFSYADTVCAAKTMCMPTAAPMW